jgi:hypothetical protein
MYGLSEASHDDWMDKGSGCVYKSGISADADLPAPGNANTDGKVAGIFWQNAGSFDHILPVATSPGSAVRRAAIKEINKELEKVNGAVYFESESCDGRNGDNLLLDDALHLAQGHRNGEDFAIRNGPFLQLSHRSVSPEYTHKASERAQPYASTARESNLPSGKWWNWGCRGCDLKFCSKMLYEEHLLECPRAILGYPLDVDEDSSSSSTTNSTEIHQQHESSHQSSCSTGYDSQSDARGRLTSVADSAGKSSCSAEASGDRADDAAMEDPVHESGRMPLVGLYGRAESFRGTGAESLLLTKDSSASHGSRIASERYCLPPSSHPQLSDYGDHPQHAIRSTRDRSSHVHNATAPPLMMRLQHGRGWTGRDAEEAGCVSGFVADSLFNLSVDGSYINRYVSLASRLL